MDSCLLLLVAGWVVDEKPGGTLGHGATLACWRTVQVAIVGQIPRQTLELARVEPSGGVLTGTAVITAVVPHVSLVVEGTLVVTAVTRVNVTLQSLTALSRFLRQLTAHWQWTLVHMAQVVTLVKS